jgi:hypothetical protein
MEPISGIVHGEGVEADSWSIELDSIDSPADRSPLFH